MCPLLSLHDGRLVAFSFVLLASTVCAIVALTFTSCCYLKHTYYCVIQITSFALDNGMRACMARTYCDVGSYTADKYVCSTEKKVASGVIVTKVLDDR